MRDAYWPAFRHDVFSLLQVGHGSLSRSRLRGAHEKEITGELARALQQMLDDPAAPDWYDHYSVHEEPRIHAPDRKGKHRRRLDLRFERTGPRPRPHYEFEAKRLCRGKSGVAEYLGVDGLGAFLNGDYAAQWPEAGMLGYIQSDDRDFWQNAIAMKISQEQALPPDGEWRPEPAVGQLPTYRSTHRRGKSLNPIRIYHVLLSFEH